MINRDCRRTDSWYFRLRAGERARLFAGLILAVVLLATFAALQAPPLQAQTTTEVEVPINWSLKPAGLGGGDKFRLLFLSSTKRNGTSTDIADYNTFIQNRANNGHTDIRAHSAGFRMVGCTADVDARDNTGTNPNTDGDGVPIYWLNGSQVAADNTDFYDGDWDDEANDKNESGNNGPDTSQVGNRPMTGCDHDGTELTLSSGTSRGLGGSSVRTGIPNTSGATNGPLSSAANTSPNNLRPMYGLSQVFTVVASPVSPVRLSLVSVSKKSLTIPEGESGSYALVLGEQPTANVRVTIGGHAGTGVDVTPTTHVFNASSWRQPVDVFVTADTDANTTNESVTLTHTITPARTACLTTSRFPA